MITGTSGRAALILGRSSRPLIPGMLMSEKTRIRLASSGTVIRSSASLAELANLIRNRPERSSRLNCCWKREATSGSSSTTRIRTLMPRASSACSACEGRIRRRVRRRGAGQDDRELGELTGLGRDGDLAAVLLHDDVVAQGQAEPGALAGRLRGKEGVEHLGLDLVRDADAVVADPDLDLAAEASGRGHERRLEARVAVLRLPFRRRVEPVRDQVQENPRDLLRIEIGLPGLRIEVLRERDVEAGLLRPGAMVGEVHALLDDGVEVRRPPLPGSLARMQQHVLDDRIGALAVLNHLFQVALQHLGQLLDLFPDAVAESGRLEGLAQLVDELGRERGEVVDEVQRVLDLVRDAGGELAERGELLRLDEAVLRSLQLGERLGQLLRARLDVLEQLRILDREDGLGREG